MGKAVINGSLSANNTLGYADMLYWATNSEQYAPNQIITRIYTIWWAFQKQRIQQKHQYIEYKSYIGHITFGGVWMSVDPVNWSKSSE